MKTTKPDHVVLIDTREQLPWEFPGSRPATLKTGDYTLAGYEDLFCVERKRSTGEIASNLTQDRFERELARLDCFLQPFVVCEFTLEDLQEFPKNSGIPPHLWRSVRVKAPFLLKRVNELQLRYRSRWVFAGSAGRAFTSSLFKRVVELYPRSAVDVETGKAPVLGA